MTDHDILPPAGRPGPNVPLARPADRAPERGHQPARAGYGSPFPHGGNGSGGAAERSVPSMNGTDGTGVTDRLTALVERVRRDPGAVGWLFPAVSRRVGRGPGPSGDPEGVLGPTFQDGARAAVVAALRDTVGPERFAEEVEALYRFGDAEEKRAVLRSLPLLGRGGDADRLAAGLIADALRGNDPRLIAAALGTPAAAALDDHAWRHGVLKCLFSDVPLAAVHGLAERADAELGRMAAGYAAEREAAGREVPADARRLIALSPHPADSPGTDDGTGAGPSAPPTTGQEA